MFNNLFVCLFRPIQSTKPAGVNNTIDHTKERKFLVRIYRSLKNFYYDFHFWFQRNNGKITNFYWPVIIHNLNTHSKRGKVTKDIKFLEIQLMSESRSRFFFVFFCLIDWLITWLDNLWLLLYRCTHTHTGCLWFERNAKILLFLDKIIKSGCFFHSPVGKTFREREREKNF